MLRRMDGVRQSEHASLVVGPDPTRPRSREVLCEGRVVGLTSIEFDVLELLMRSAGRVVSRDAMMTRVLPTTGHAV